MKELNKLISEIGISKVSLAKYLGVSRQMLYNYLGLSSIEKWPEEKKEKVFLLFNVKNEKELKELKLNGEMINEINSRIENASKASSKEEIVTDLKNFNRKEQGILSDIINLLKEKLEKNSSKETYSTYLYLYHFLQSMDANPELKYFLAYESKLLGFTDPMKFDFNENKQFIFESIMYSASTMYKSGNLSKSKINERHKAFVEEISHDQEEKLGRTLELNINTAEALKELGYTEINSSNAKEVLEKIAEIESRKV